MTSFLHPPNQLLATTTYLRPDSSECHPTVSVSLGWGGVGVVFTIASSRTSASAVISVLTSPSNVSVSTKTTPSAAPMSLSIW